MTDADKEYAKELARKALEAIASRPPRPPGATRVRNVYVPAADERVKGSQDALDHRGFQRGGFSKAEKRAYAQQKFAEELTLPPKEPPPEWTSNPDLLPKKPPGRTE